MSTVGETQQTREFFSLLTQSHKLVQLLAMPKDTLFCVDLRDPSVPIAVCKPADNTGHQIDVWREWMQMDRLWFRRVSELGQKELFETLVSFMGEAQEWYIRPSNAVIYLRPQLELLL